MMTSDPFMHQTKESKGTRSQMIMEITSIEHKTENNAALLC